METCRAAAECNGPLCREQASFFKFLVEHGADFDGIIRQTFTYAVKF